MAPRRAPFFRTWNVVLLTLHRQEELVVGLGGFQLVDQDLDGGDFVHRVQQLAQDPHALQFVVGSQQLFAAGTGTVDVDGREHTLFSDTTVQGQFDIARGAEETFRFLQGVGIDTTGQYLAGARDHGVVGTGQTGDGVEQDHHVFLVFDQALGLLDHHFGNLHVAGWRLIERRGNHFAAHGALHFGHFFRTFIDQQHDQVNFRVVTRNVRCNVLQHDGLTGFRRCDDQATLALADRSAQVDHTTGQVFGGTVAGFHLHAHGREQRSQVLEENLVFRVLGTIEVDRVDLEQGEITLAFLRRADLANDGVTGAQVEATDLARRDIDIVWAGEIGSVRRAEEAEAVLENLQHAITGNFLAAFRVLFEQGENHILLARTGHIFYAHLFGQLEQVGNRLLLEFSQIHIGMT